MSANGTTLPERAGISKQSPLNRADEADDLLTGVKGAVIDFIRAADNNASTLSEGHGLQQPGQGPRTVLLEHHPPKKLQALLNFALPEEGQGKEGLMRVVNDVLKYSANIWDQGFLDKLYASITPVGLAADLLLSALNTNVHVYQVSPALTLIEKQTGKAFAEMFGLRGTFSGGYVF